MPEAGATGPVAVIGGGTMGAGIAAAVLRLGEAVRLVEYGADRTAPARAAVSTLLQRVEASQDRVADRMAALDVLDGLPARDDAVALVIEAVPEDPTLKREVLARAERAFPQARVLATNTSSLSIDALAKALERPRRFVGMHFFNPVLVSQLVEVVRGEATEPDAVRLAEAWAERLDKTSIVVRDSPGFATSRLGVAIGLEAIRMLEEGVASAEDIDRAMVLGYRFPVGPLRLTDIVGLDVRLAIAEHLADELGPRFEPPHLLRELVAAGCLGKKTGKGFFPW